MNHNNIHIKLHVLSSNIIPTNTKCSKHDKGKFTKDFGKILCGQDKNYAVV